MISVWLNLSWGYDLADGDSVDLEGDDNVGEWLNNHTDEHSNCAELRFCSTGNEMGNLIGKFKKLKTKTKSGDWKTRWVVA